MIDFFASETHYAEHLLPVWFALDEEDRGQFYGPNQVAELLAREGIHPEQAAPPLDVYPVVIAGMKDFARVPQRPVALLEHGAGQTYEGVDNPSYAGGVGRGGVRLFLCPSGRVARMNEERYPHAQAVAIGCPKLDQWAGSQTVGAHERPVVAVSFHYNERAIPETRWAFPAFQDEVARLAANPVFRVIGHGHPRQLRKLRDFYDENGIEIVAEFDDIIRQADVYVVDNSSTLYEAAFADIPTVVLNAPWYRKDVEHGLRFWSHIPGLQCEEGDDLSALVAEAYLTREATREWRQIVSRYVYANQGAAGSAGAEALMRHFAGVESKMRRRGGRSPYRAPVRKLPPILPERRFRRLGANKLLLNEARLRWVELTPAERSEEQARLAALSDRQLSAALAETLAEEALVRA